MKTFSILISAIIIALASCKKENAIQTTAHFQIDNLVGDGYAKEGTPLKITNDSKNASSYVWDFGDGKKSKETAPNNISLSCGMHTITLTVTDNKGETISYSQTYLVLCSGKTPNHTPQAPVLQVGVLPIGG